MTTSKHLNRFNENEVIHELKHFLPAQAPLKDFIHHNTLHAFQNLKWDNAIRQAEKMFGYKVSLSLNDYRNLYFSKKISHDILERTIVEKKGAHNIEDWSIKTIYQHYDESSTARIGNLRSFWKTQYHINIDSVTHPKLFRILCSYLDQGIAIWKFPINEKGFLTSLRELEKISSVSIFNSEEVKNLFLNQRFEIEELLCLLVGDEKLYKQYLFDQ